MTRLSSLITVLLAVLAAPAAAQTTTTFGNADLGRAGTDAACLARAQATLQAYVEEVGAGSPVQSQGWAVGVYRIANDEIYGEILCSFGPEGETRATLVLFAREADQTRFDAAMSRLPKIWAAQ